MADKLTRSARTLKRKTNYTSLPQNPIDFTINDIAINSHYALRSKKAYHSINLRIYLQQKHLWSDNTINSIWWKPYYNSLSKLSYHEKVIIYKFIHDPLPTKARENKYYTFRDKKCTQCQCDHEDEDHILKCLCIKSQQTRNEWIIELQSYLSQNHTPRIVANTIIHNITQWLEPSQVIDFINEETTINMTNALKKQQLIGWRHFIRGRISIEWGKILSQHLVTEKLNQISAEKWAADLLYINWKHILKMWRDRCVKLHGNTPDAIEQNTKNRSLHEIQYIQSINQNLNHSPNDWLLEDIDELRNYTNKQLQTWLYGAKIISKNNQQQIKQQLQLNRQNQTWQSGQCKPHEEPIEKGDLDPGD
jgi:hypothetical protein